MYNDESGSGSDLDSFTVGLLERATERRRLYSSAITSAPRESLTIRAARRNRELKKMDNEEEEEVTKEVVEDEEEEEAPNEVVEEEDDIDDDEESFEEEPVPVNSSKYSRAIEANPAILPSKSELINSEELSMSSSRSSPRGRLSRLNALASNINAWEDDLNHFVSSKPRFLSPPKVSNTSGRNSPTAGVVSKSVLTSNTYSSSTNNSVRKSLLPVLGNQSVGGSNGGGNNKSSSPSTCRILDLELKKSPTSSKVTTVATAKRLNFNKESRQVEIITEKVGPNCWDKSILNSLEAQGFVPKPTKTKLTDEYIENLEPAGINSAESNISQNGPVDTSPKKLVSPPKVKPVVVVAKVSPPLTTSPIRNQVDIDIDTLETPRSGLSLAAKTALFESISTSVVEKDPTEMTVAQRAKLFEKKSMIGSNSKAAASGRLIGTRGGGKVPIDNLGRRDPVPSTFNKFRPSVSSATPTGNVENRRRLFETQLKETLDSLDEAVPHNRLTNTRQLTSRPTTTNADKIQLQTSKIMAPPAPPPMPASTATTGRRSSVSPKKCSPAPATSSPNVSGSVSPNRSPPHMGSPNKCGTPKRSVSPSSRSPSPKSKYPGARDVKRIRLNEPKPGHMYPSLTDIETDTTDAETEVDVDMAIDNDVGDYDADMDSETSMLSGTSLGAQIERMAKAKGDEFETPTPRRNPFHRRTEDFSASLACRQIDAYIDEALDGQDFTLDTVIESQLNPQSSSTPKGSIRDDEEREYQPENVWKVSDEISRTNSRNSIDDTLKAQQSSAGSLFTTTAIEVHAQPDESPKDPAPENVIVQDPTETHTENCASPKKLSPVAYKQDSSCMVTSSPLYSKSKNVSPVGTPLMHTVSVYRKQQGNTMALTPRVKLREEKLSPNEIEIPAPELPTDKTSLNSLIAKLDEEVAHQQRSIGQISKALSLCKSSVEFSDSTENVECERILLIATQKRTALLNEIHRLKTEGILSKMTAVSPSKQDLSPTCRGTMTVSDVKVPHNLKNTNVYPTTATPVPDTVCHFICLARYRDQLEVSPLVSIGEGPSAGSNVRFPNSFSFKNLEPEFEVRMDFYVLRSRKEFLPHEAKYHINTKEKTPKKSKDAPKLKLGRGYQASPAGPDAVRTSNFKLCGSLVLNISNLGRSSYRLEGGLNPLDGSVTMEIECSAQDGVEERGFLTIFDDVAGFGAWHRRWCRLTPTELISYMYPEDEQSKIPNPHSMITLRNCVTSNVKPVDRETCARANTFMLVISRPRRDTDKESLVTICDGKNTYVKHLISADSKEERDLWCQKLNRALANMRAWDPQCYSSKDSSQF